MSAFLSRCRTRPAAAARRGYTLVEMLMVTAIIGLLIGLLLMASMKVISSTNRSVGKISQQAIDLAVMSGDKLHRPGPLAAEGGRPELIPDEYVIDFSPTARPEDEANRLLAAFGGGSILHIYDSPESKGCAVHITGTSVAALRGHPSVQAVEQNQRYYLTAEIIPTGVSRLSAATNTNRNIPSFTPGSVGLPNNVTGTLVHQPTSPTCIIAIIDSGVDSTHPDLNVTFARSFVAGVAPVTPAMNQHGTHVAGTAGAKGNNNLGVIGVLPGAEIWNLRVFPDGANPSAATADIIAAVKFAGKNNFGTVRVANLSLGGGPSPALNNACTTCANTNTIVCVAAGNFQDDSAFYSPANAAGVVCVAAMSDSDGKWGGLGGPTSFGDADDTFALGFSNYGNVVDVIAPGVDILSTWPVLDPLGPYNVISGTSMACPNVAGFLGTFSASTVRVGNVTRLARGLELCSLLVSAGKAEKIRGPGSVGLRDYPMLIDRTGGGGGGGRSKDAWKGF